MFTSTAVTLFSLTMKENLKIAHPNSVMSFNGRGLLKHPLIYIREVSLK
jgi:hypothetical protein